MEDEKDGPTIKLMTMTIEQLAVRYFDLLSLVDEISEDTNFGLLDRQVQDETESMLQEAQGNPIITAMLQTLRENAPHLDNALMAGRIGADGEVEVMSFDGLTPETLEPMLEMTGLVECSSAQIQAWNPEQLQEALKWAMGCLMIKNGVIAHTAFPPTPDFMTSARRYDA